MVVKAGEAEVKTKEGRGHGENRLLSILEIRWARGWADEVR